MTWFLILLGVILLGFGVFTAMSGEIKAERTAPRPAANKGGEGQNAWDVITQPLPQPGELIEIPTQRPWYQLGRFGQGVAVGFGAGCLVAAMAVAITPGDAAATRSGDNTPPPSAGQPADSAGGQTPAPQPPAADPTPEPPKQEEPAPVQEFTFDIEMGELPGDIAEKLVSINLITSEQDFLDRLVARGLDSQLKSGTFTVPSNATLDEVIDILTR